MTVVTGFLLYFFLTLFDYVLWLLAQNRNPSPKEISALTIARIQTWAGQASSCLDVCNKHKSWLQLNTSLVK